VGALRKQNTSMTLSLLCLLLGCFAWQLHTQHPGHLAQDLRVGNRFAILVLIDDTGLLIYLLQKQRSSELSATSFVQNDWQASSTWQLTWASCACVIFFSSLACEIFFFSSLGTLSSATKQVAI